MRSSAGGRVSVRVEAATGSATTVVCKPGANAGGQVPGSARAVSPAGPEIPTGDPVNGTGLPVSTHSTRNAPMIAAQAAAIRNGMVPGMFFSSDTGHHVHEWLPVVNDKCMVTSAGPSDKFPKIYLMLVPIFFT